MPRFAAIERAVSARGRRIVFLLRLSPLIPFNFLNYALGLTTISLWDFTVAALGMIPSTILYAYAGKVTGEALALAPRPVEVHALELVDYAPPDIRFRATVSAGTYLRGLARDVGDALACGAHLAALRRTAVGPFELQDAVAPDAVTAAGLRDPAVLVAHLARQDLTAEERDAAVHGRPIDEGRMGKGERGMVALFFEGHLVAVAEAVGESLKPRVVVTEA